MGVHVFVISASSSVLADTGKAKAMQIINTATATRRILLNTLRIFMIFPESCVTSCLQLLTTIWELHLGNSGLFGVRKLACAFAAICCLDTKAAAGCRTPDFLALGFAPAYENCLELIKENQGRR